MQEIARSRTEPASRVERARIILGYLAEPSAYAVARAVGVTAQTVSRCLDRAAELGVIEALDDRQRTGRDPTITAEARTWLVALACQKPKALGYSHELWTPRLLAAHARDRGPSFRLIGTHAGLRPKIPKLVFDTTVAPGRRGCLVDKRGLAPIPAGCSDDQQAPLAGEADLRFGAAVEPSISDFSPSRPR